MPSTRKPCVQQKKTSPAARIHPDQRASAERLNKLAAALYGPPAPKQAISYYTGLRLPGCRPRRVAADASAHAALLEEDDLA
jgi:hypothetical protein